MGQVRVTAVPALLRGGGNCQSYTMLVPCVEGAESCAIAAHHALAAMIFRAFQAHSEGRWQLHIEVAVSSLRTIPVPLDLYDILNRMIDGLEEPDEDTDRVAEEHPQDLSRLRPDAWGISWGNRQVLLLEPTRAHDQGQEWYEISDAFKTQRYKRLQERMNLLPRGWAVEIVPLTVRIRGSFYEPGWLKTLDRFGISSQVTQ